MRITLKNVQQTGGYNREVILSFTGLYALRINKGVKVMIVTFEGEEKEYLSIVLVCKGYTIGVNLDYRTNSANFRFPERLSAPDLNEVKRILVAQKNALSKSIFKRVVCVPTPADSHNVNTLLEVGYVESSDGEYVLSL